MSGYYPPGVTGNEYAIAGGVERTMTVSCNAVGINMLPREPVDEVIGSILQGLKTRLTVQVPPATGKVVDGWRQETPEEVIARVLARAKAMIPEMHEQTREVDEECGFEGEIDVEVFGHMIRWTCPRCGTEIEDDRALEPDPDWDRD